MPIFQPQPRRRPPFEFGAPEPDLTEATYEGLFEPQNDIQNIRVASVLDQPPVDPVSQYVQETAATEHFKRLLEQQPERGDPGFMDRLAGAAAYLGNKQRNIPGGLAAAENTKYAGYNRELSDWKAKIEPAQTAATQENTRNVNSRNLAALEVKERNDTRRLDETERKNRAAEKIRQQNADIQAAKAANPDYEFNFTGPKVIVTRPGSPVPIVTDIDTGNVTEMTKLLAAQKRAQTIADAAQTRTETKPGMPITIPGPNGPITAMIDPVQRPDGTYSATPVTLNPPSGVPRPPVAPTGVPQGGNGRIRATPIMPGGVVLPTEAPPEGGAPPEAAVEQQPQILGQAYKMGVQPPPAEMGAIRAMAQETLDLLEKEIFDSSSLDKTDANGKPIPPKLRPEVDETVGSSRLRFGRWNPTSDAAGGEAVMKTFHDRLVLDLIGKMKSQSKTGATGFGQLTGPELTLLINASSKLSNWYLNEDKYLIPELMKIRDRLKKVMLPPGDQVSVTSAIPPIYEENDSGQIRVSTDNGKTWKPFKQ